MVNPAVENLQLSEIIEGSKHPWLEWTGIKSDKGHTYVFYIYQIQINKATKHGYP